MNDLVLIGDKRLIEKLYNLQSLNARSAQIKAAFNRASKPMIQAAKAASTQRRKSGVLYRSIKILSSKKYKSLFWVGPAHGKKQKNDAWYAYFQERTTDTRTTDKGFHRGRIRGIRFMEKAYTNTKGKVRLNIIAELNKLIKKLAV